MSKPQIKVFSTKAHKIRARIKEAKTSVPFEVTVGGSEWNDGKGREFEDEIIIKSQYLINSLEDEFIKLTKNKIQ